MVKKIRLALFDNDGYMKSFVGYVCKKYRNIVETRLFTDFAMLEKQVQSGKIDVLLASEEFVERFQLYSDQIPQMVFLSEGNMGKEKSKFPVIFKYQAVSKIVKEIFELMAENDRISYHTEIVSKRTVEMICGYAPFGGGGVTEFLFQKAESLAKKRKVLYVNLEEFHGFSHVQKEKQGGMSEVLFYLRQKRGKLALKLESVLYRKGDLACIFSVEDYRDLHSMTKEDMAEFLQVLQEQTEYEVFVFDIGFLGEAGIFLMERCDKIYMPRPENRIQSSKEEAFEKNLRASGQEKIIEKREWLMRPETGKRS
ncbi:MAG: hypothetical protein IJ733_09935 [Lachnospiraceae bacterium]|nr:hypothetical protein [Lachnospiraceae bacterium]